MTDPANAQASTHGHEVMRLLGAAGPEGITRAQLAATVAEQFGADARFHTCSAEGLTLDGLLGFLSERGKVVERSDRVHVEMGKMCDHG